MDWSAGGRRLGRCFASRILRSIAGPIIGLLVLALGMTICSAATTVVDFDNPVPPGAPFSVLQGVFAGIDFGSGQWRWEGPFGANPTNNIFFDRETGTSRTFRFQPAPKILERMTVFSPFPGTLTLVDDTGQTITGNIAAGALQVVATGWTRGSTAVTVDFSAGWSLGIDDLTYRDLESSDITPPTVTITAPSSGSTVSGTITIAADAADDVGVQGVRFLMDGVSLGAEDVSAPYAVLWPTTTTANGTHTLVAIARDAAGNQATSSPITVTVANIAGGGAGYALRFHGNGVNDIDRVKILVDDPTTTAPGPPVDVGATDFTLEFWLRANVAENPAPAVQCGANLNWIFGHIVIDRDRYNQNRKFGISLAGGVVVFGVSGDGTGDRTICGTTSVLDNQWHHIAVQRRRADGRLSLYVDGALQAQVDGPDGDVSYPDDGVPGNFCNGPCTNSDPFLVIGAEKHDVGPQFPSFSGWIDELRISNVLRYGPNFARPSAPFVPDSATVALYHFDEGAGDVIADTSGAVGGPSHGVRRFGGTPAGPEWILSDAPLAASVPDTTPPTPPATLTASGSTTAASLSWTPSTDDVGVAGYNVHRSTFPGLTPTAANLIAQVTATSHVDSGLSPGTYFYIVTARDAAGNVSAASNEASAVVTSAPGPTVTVNFDTPAPPGAPFDLLQGTFQDVDFGSAQWRWEGPYGPDSTNHIFFASSIGTSRTFRFSTGPRILNSLRVFTLSVGTLTLSDDAGQTFTRSVTTGPVQLITTGWTRPSTTVTVGFTAGWELGIDDIAHSAP